MKIARAVLFGLGGALVGALVTWALLRSAPPPAGAAWPDRISVGDLRAKLSRAEVVVIDVRDMDSYVAAHIPGALHIPLSYIQQELPYLPRGKPIVTYCT
jgi:hypothetical protein